MAATEEKKQHFVEVLLLNGTDFRPGSSKDPLSMRCDPYYILNLKSKGNEMRHKSGIQKHTRSPVFYEIFILEVPDTLLNKQGGIDDVIEFKVYDFKTVGFKKKLDKPFEFDLHNLKLNDSIAHEHKYPQYKEVPEGSSTGAVYSPKIRFNVTHMALPKSRIPKALVSRTGGITKDKYLNSISRTVIKNAFRGDRGGATAAVWVDLKIHGIRNLERNGGVLPSQVNLEIQLNSTRKKVKSLTKKVKKDNCKFTKENDFGFEVPNVGRDFSLLDAFRITCAQSGPNGTWNPRRAYSFLDTLAEGETRRQWESFGMSDMEVDVEVTRLVKHVDDLSESTMVKLQSKLIYALNLVKLMLAKAGIACTVSIGCKVGIFKVFASITIDPASVDTNEEEHKLEQLDDEIDHEADDETADAIDEDEEEEKEAKSTVLRRILTNSIRKAIIGLRQTILKAQKNGITGSIGVGIEIEVFSLFNFEIEFEVAMSEGAEYEEDAITSGRSMSSSKNIYAENDSMASRNSDTQKKMTQQ